MKHFFCDLLLAFLLEYPFTKAFLHFLLRPAVISVAQNEELYTQNVANLKLFQSIFATSRCIHK